MTNTDDIKITDFNDAQLHWDDQDPKNAGWVLRWRDERGQTETVEIGEDVDAGIEALAFQAAACAPDYATGRIRILRGDRDAGVAMLDRGVVVSWRVS